MPKRVDIKKILIIGAGPIVIGQACEFDYSGAQACKSLKEEGYKVILINSNPATIMTDPDLADKTYIEPITKDFVKQIIELEKPDALLPTMGGQTALNVSMELAKLGILEKYNVKMIGANPDAIELAEDRQKFKDAMREIGLKCPESFIVEKLPEAIEVKARLKLPLVIRPSFTLGGTGGGVAYTDKEFEELCQRGLNASPTSQILIEKSVSGWKEFEMEVVRDSKDNCIIVCSIENIDPMGVHTGDSITVAPSLTLTDKEYQILRNASIKVLQKIGVDTGGSNVQFAINPEDGEINVIEMNPRVSRSSALASKATGFPIAKIAAKLAVGYSLDELENDITKTTPASFEPTIDYVVTKIPRFTFEKFTGADSNLTTSMKSVGETMSIGRSFTESLQKGFSSLEYGLDGLDIPQNKKINKQTILDELKIQSSQRLLTIGHALRLGIKPNEINNITKYDKWFIYQLKKIIEIENLIEETELSKEIILLAKNKGFTEREVFNVDKDFKWDQFIHAINNLSLFSEKKVFDLRIRNAKLDQDGKSAIEAFLDHKNPDLVLLIRGPKLESAHINSKWFKTHLPYIALVQIWPVNRKELKNWLSQRLIKEGINADRDALQLLSDKVEGNLLAAIQEIEKLKLLSNKKIICPNNLLNVAHNKKGVKIAVVNAGKPLPMLSIDRKSVV